MIRRRISTEAVRKYTTILTRIIPIKKVKENIFAKVGRKNVFSPDYKSLVLEDIPVSRFIPKKLSEEAFCILSNPNAGGNSKKSEAYAMEILHREYQACGVKSENDIKYHSDHWKKCDFITRIKGENIGVSVARCLPRVHDDLRIYIETLLYKKLYGLVVAKAGVIEDTFLRSILFIWCPDLASEILVRELFYFSWKSLKPHVRLITRQAPKKLLLRDFRITE